MARNKSQHKIESDTLKIHCNSVKTKNSVAKAFKHILQGCSTGADPTRHPMNLWSVTESGFGPF